MPGDIPRGDHGRNAWAVRFRACCLRKGWDVGRLAREAGVSRTTLYHLERGLTRRPRLSTLSRIAAALDIAPEELSSAKPAIFLSGSSDQQRFDRATNISVAEASDNSPELFANWTREHWDELYSTFGVGGNLTPDGVNDVACRMNWKRETVRQLNLVLETHLSEVASSIVAALYKMVRPDLTGPHGQPPSGA